MMASEVKHYLHRARDFLKGMDLLREDPTVYRYSAALLGIHAAISYCDALRIGMGSESLASENHQSASDELRELLSGRKFKELGGVNRLGRLLAKKSRIAYSPEASSEDEIKDIVQRAERFAAWAEITGAALKIGGWSDD